MSWTIEMWMDNLNQRTHLMVVERGQKIDIASFPPAKASAVQKLEKEFRAFVGKYTSNGKTNWRLVARAFQTLINKSSEIPPATQAEADKLAELQEFQQQFRKFHKWADEARSGEFPQEAFRWTVDGRELMEGDFKALAAETSRYLRLNIGRVPEITPAPRGGVPFSYQSDLLGRVIEAELRVDFFNEMREWALRKQTELQKAGRLGRSLQ